MKLPEGPITGEVFALSNSRESLARELGSKYSSPTLYETYEEASEEAYYDDDRSVFKIQVTII